jgi:FkbM family methyltransferase
MHKPDAAFYAQYGEDIILARIFGDLAKGVAVEAGAFDGKAGSNSAHFDDIGWQCILVEPNPSLATRIRQTRPNALLYECAVGAREGEVTLHVPLGAETLASVSDGSIQADRMARSTAEIASITVRETTLDTILSDSGIERLDFITIDVEGHELEVLKGFSLDRWKPRILIIEDNSSGTNDEVLNYLQQRNYVRIRNTGCNDWYCRQDDAALVQPLPILFTECKKALKGIKKVVFRHAHRIWAVRERGKSIQAPA